MTDTIRCPACRGSKKVPKLGGMIGECNTCLGKGTILLADKPKPVIAAEAVSQDEIINAVADCVPASDISPYKDTTVAGELIVEVNPVSLEAKKALYKGNRKVNIK